METANTEQSTNSSSVSKEAVRICYFCHEEYDCTLSEKLILGIRQDRIHRSCCIHLQEEHITEEFLNWNDETALPLCTKCLMYSQKLCRMNDKLEETQRKIDGFVDAFTVKFMNSREKNATSTSILSDITFEDDFDIVHGDSSEIDPDLNKAEQLGTVKQEQPDAADYFDESQLNEHFYDSEELHSDHDSNEDEPQQETSTNNPIRERKPTRDNKSKYNNQNTQNPLLKSLELKIQKIEFDEDGKPILEQETLPPRKAAIKAKATCSSWAESLSGRSKNKRAAEMEQFPGSDSNREYKFNRKMKMKLLKKEMYKASTKKKIGKSLNCKMCGLIFSTNSKLRIHVKSHVKKEGRMFSCSTCASPFKDRNSLMRHQEAHSNLRMYKCPHCDKSYKYKRNLKDHVKSSAHHEDQSIECDLCKKASNIQSQSSECNSKTIKNEFGEIEGESTRLTDSNSCDEDSGCSKSSIKNSKARGSHICEHCGKVCATPYKLKLHSRRHTGEKKFSCDICGKRFFDRHDTKRHQETHVVERAYKCDHCDKSYKYHRNVKEHILRHHSEQSRLLQDKEAEEGPKRRIRKKNKHGCLDCNEFFPDKFSYHCHKYSHLPEGTEVTCCECKIVVADLAELRQHFPIHVELRSFLCSFCGDQFKNQIAQTEHEILHYNLSEEEIKGKYFPCTECPKIFISSSRLKNHSFVHSKERPFGPCEVCGATFKSAHIFKSHQRIHHVDRTKFQCTVCSKLFSSRGCLNKHMYLHNEEKLFACFCGKKFSNRSGLTAHSVYHKTDRPYLCEECGQGFYTGTKLREHYRIHTGMLLYCEFCPKGFKNSTLLKQHQLVHDKPLAPIRPKRVRKNNTEKRQRKASHNVRTENSEILKTSKELEVAVEEIVHFQCHICDERFEGEVNITRHMEIHNDADVLDAIVVM